MTVNASARFPIRSCRGCLAAVVLLAAGLFVPSLLATQTDGKGAVPIYRKILSDRADYHGPEREEAEPVGIHEIRIGFFAPRDRRNPIGQNMWQGATLAVEKANAEGGYRGKSFRLVCRWADNPWGAGSREMTRLVYEDKVWAVIGSIDGASTHIAEQVATRARITLISPLSGDPSLTHTAVPWMFRLPPDDSSVAEILVRLAIEKYGHRRIILLTSSDHDGRTGATEVVSALGRLQVPPVLHLTFTPDQNDFSPQLSRIELGFAGALFLWGTPESSARFLMAIRERGIQHPVFAPTCFSLPSFLKEAGQSAERLTTCPLAWGRNETRCEKFAREYGARFGEPPADDAILGYDAANMLIEAIRRKGLNRARIRDALAEMSGFVGLAGTIQWDNGGGNTAKPVPATVHEGKLRPIQD